MYTPYIYIYICTGPHAGRPHARPGDHVRGGPTITTNNNITTTTTTTTNNNNNDMTMNKISDNVKHTWRTARCARSCCARRPRSPRAAYIYIYIY